MGMLCKLGLNNTSQLHSPLQPVAKKTNSTVTTWDKETLGWRMGSLGKHFNLTKINPQIQAAGLGGDH